MYVCMYVYVRMYVCMYVCMSVLSVYMYVMYVHIQTKSNSDDGSPQVHKDELVEHTPNTNLKGPYLYTHALIHSYTHTLIHARTHTLIHSYAHTL